MKYIVTIEETARYEVEVDVDNSSAAYLAAEKLLMENLACPYPCEVTDRGQWSIRLVRVPRGNNKSPA